MKRSVFKPVPGAVGLVLCLAVPGLAQIEKTSVGAINATIGGEPYAGDTLDVPSEGTATADFQSFGPVTMISVQAHDPQDESIMHNVLSIEISLMGEGASATLMEDPTVWWWPEGMSEPFYFSEDSGVVPDVKIDELSLEDGAAAIKGSFSAQICRKESMFAEADMNECKPIEGTFDTALRKVNTDF
ncbi:hypothetical protein [Qingshengfaniella alkalisoli]|nr:hypothetical protein [Qingshengfaniella alkalisoli]